MIIISLEVAFSTEVLAPHEAPHSDTFVGQVKWLKCGFTVMGIVAARREASRLEHRRETTSSQCRTQIDSWKIVSLEMLGLDWRWRHGRSKSERCGDRLTRVVQCRCRQWRRSRTGGSFTKLSGVRWHVARLLKCDDVTCELEIFPDAIWFPRVVG